MYGLIGEIEAVAGQGAELAAILANVGPMPGCLNYIVAVDSQDPDVIWVTELWESAQAHAASLELPSVQEVIAEGRPLIAGFRSHHELSPIGGIGIGSP
ncbi:MAG TPA: putative quinol monooxygenase [Acidimicrobiia bacterium]|nr:putative quinol monooxygenase [Acidimicrobiia bacterium]